MENEQGDGGCGRGRALGARGGYGGGYVGGEGRGGGYWPRGGGGEGHGGGYGHRGRGHGSRSGGDAWAQPGRGRAGGAGYYVPQRALPAPAPAWWRIETGEVGSSSGSVVSTGNSKTHLDKKSIKIMTYNVWFREDVELFRRMCALGDLIQHHRPDLICFQEVTPNIYQLLQRSDWWQEYKCSLSHKKAMERRYYCMQMIKMPENSFDRIPFANSIMGRELCIADVNTGGGMKLVLATSHLESPNPEPPRWDQMYSEERVAQANESLRILGGFRNVVFCGDMNWDDQRDGPFPLPDGWIDAWAELVPGANGWTYDTKANGMLRGNHCLQKRLDRFVCRLSDFKVDSIEMIGKEAIPGISYLKEKKGRELELPVLPSDHFGLVLRITECSKSSISRTESTVVPLKSRLAAPTSAKNLAVAGGLSALLLGACYYTMRAIGGTDELQVKDMEEEEDAPAAAGS